MGRYLLRRLALSVVVLVGVLVITFLISHVIPGDPARLYAGGLKASDEQVAQARVELGLDRPLPAQFADYVGGLATGDFGRSFVTKREVTDDLAEFVPATLELVVPTMLLALLVGIPIGVISGTRRGGRTDRASRFLAISGAALPTFWIAILAQLVLAVWLGWLPLSGRVSTDVTVNHPVQGMTGFLVLDAALAGNWVATWDALRHLVVPVVVLAIHPTSLIIRQTRAAVASVMNETYVTAARASGLPEWMVDFRFALKNALIPTLTVLGLVFAGSLTGTVLIEVIFSWPGVGRYVTTSIEASDFAPIIAVTLLATLGYVTINLVVDIVQAILDPRVRA